MFATSDVFVVCRLNSTMDSIEIVVVGKCGSGKSSFLEALLDVPFAVSRKGMMCLK